MRLLKLAIALGLGAALSACGASDVVTRDAPFQTPSMASPGQIAPGGALGIAPALAEKINVADIRVTVPRRLRVSEANIYYPLSDIVWRGDAMGDRYQQIEAIFDEAFARGTQGFEGASPVILEAEVERFHSLTEKARYTYGGVHNIVFKIQLRDARTGALLGEPRRVDTSLKGYGGSVAIAAEARGETQKVRITQHLATLIQQELLRPEGYVNASASFFQSGNNI